MDRACPKKVLVRRLALDGIAAGGASGGYEATSREQSALLAAAGYASVHRETALSAHRPMASAPHPTA